MAQCHDPAPSALATAPEELTIALAGHPNVGKSTLFNALTGSHQRAVNAPRTTVSYQSGTWRAGERRLQLLDLPGTYSMVPQSQDEEVTAQALDGQVEGIGRPSVVIVVADATALASSLYLFAQIAERGHRIVLALTLTDVARGRGIEIDDALLAARLGVPVVALNPRLGQGTEALAAAVLGALDGPGPGPAQPLAPAAAIEDLDAMTEHAEALFGFAAGVTGEVVTTGEPRRSFSDRIDAVVLRWWAGIPLFLAVLWAAFQATTQIAAPIQDFFEGLVMGPVADGVTWLLARLSLDDTWVRGFAVDGVLTGVAVVVSFLPLMAIMFLLITLLEDSGYMARVAMVADRAMRALGLDGRAVLPLVIGFGCNIPALAATKTLPNSRQRTLTGLLVPFTSCTARLVVYLLLATVFFPGQAGTVVFLMYVTSALLIVAIGWVLRKTAFKDVRREPLVIALPAYQVPRVMMTLKQIVLRCRAFLLDAGKVIVVLTVAVWLLMSIPVHGSHAFGEQDMPPRDSALGAASMAIAPVFSPAGFGDWRAASSLISGFVAKEAVVGTLAASFGLDSQVADDPTQPGDLGAKLRAAFDASSGGHGGAAAIAFMIFCLAYTPCLVTVAEQRRLFGLKLTSAAVAASVVGAWLLATLVFQIGRLL